MKFTTNLAEWVNLISKVDIENCKSKNRLYFPDDEKYEELFQMQLDLANDLFDDNVKHIIYEHIGYFDITSKTLDNLNILGVNKKTSILNYIRGIWIRNKKHFDDNDLLFLEIINQVKNRVLASDNYIHLPDEELELCIEIIVTYAFMSGVIF